MYLKCPAKVTYCGMVMSSRAPYCSVLNSPASFKLEALNPFHCILQSTFFSLALGQKNSIPHNSESYDVCSGPTPHPEKN